MGKKVLTLSLLFLLAPSSFILAATTGIITGVVKDAQTGEPLPGANVSLQGTAIGAATDLDGEYRISRVPAGNYTLIVNFIGYRKETLPVKVLPGETTRLDAELDFEVVKGKAVVVTALLEGQLAAINQQLSSNTIVNIVASDRIQELPDANAAESVGRMPGVAIERNAGEGQKLIIRGMSPKFNAVTINGERIPATGGSGGAFTVEGAGTVGLTFTPDTDDRSVDLSVISQDALASIELFKAPTADMDGDAIGGTVRFAIFELIMNN